jgi:hypothetical protein
VSAVDPNEPRPPTTREEFDAYLDRVENQLANLTIQLPLLLRDVRDLRARMRPAKQPSAPSGAEVPEQPEGGQDEARHDPGGDGR